MSHHFIITYFLAFWMLLVFYPHSEDLEQSEAAYLCSQVFSSIWRHGQSPLNSMKPGVPKNVRGHSVLLWSLNQLEQGFCCCFITSLEQNSLHFPLLFALPPRQGIKWTNKAKSVILGGQHQGSLIIREEIKAAIKNI